VWRYTPGSPGSYAPFAGTGAAGYSGDGGAAASAQLNNPSGLAVDSLGNLYIADMGNSRVRKVDHANGQITTVAGNGMFGLAGDGGPAYLSELANPFDVTVDSAGDIYIADTFNQRIREINTRGVITSVVGICGVVGAFSGDNGPASIGHINYPVSVGVDPVGDLSVADIANNRVRTVQEPIPARGAVCPSPAGTPGARGVSPTNPASPLARIVNHQTSKRPLVPDQALHSGPAHVTKPIRSQTAPRRPTQTHLNPAGSSTSQGHPLARGGGTGSWPAAAQTARSSGGVMLLTSGVLVLVLVSGGVVGLRRKRRREGSAGPPS